MPRTADPFKQRFNWVMDQLKKRDFPIGGVTVDPNDGTFTVLTVDGTEAKLSPYEKWKQNQDKSPSCKEE